MSKKYVVPYSIIINGEFEVSATGTGHASVLARRWLSSNEGKGLHKTLLEAGTGLIRVRTEHIREAEEDDADQAV